MLRFIDNSYVMGGSVDWLNYHHLYYFWMVAREGTIAAAAIRLRVSQPTISTQLASLELQLGHALFQKMGRRLGLTEQGRVVFRYADEIFTLGSELVEHLKGEGAGVRRLRVGVADVLPKLVVARLLEPLLLGPQASHVVCREGRPEELLPELAVHTLDLVLSDTPISPTVKVKAFHHLLGESAVSTFATPGLAARYRVNFPSSLDGAPVLFPTENNVLRRSLDQWLSQAELAPRVVAELEDSALVKTLAERGHGLCFAPRVVADDLARQYGLVEVGVVPGVKERFYVLSVERKLRHPAVVLLQDAAREGMFGA